MFSYRNHKGNIIVDAGGFIVLTAAMLYHEWCPVALKMDGTFSSAKYYGFELPANRLPALKEALKNRLHVIALSRKAIPSLYLVMPAMKRFEDEQEYLESLEKKLKYPSLEGAKTITALYPKVRKFISLKYTTKPERA